jgi:hypothetical protein
MNIYIINSVLKKKNTMLFSNLKKKKNIPIIVIDFYLFIYL